MGDVIYGRHHSYIIALFRLFYSTMLTTIFLKLYALALGKRIDDENIIFFLSSQISLQLCVHSAKIQYKNVARSNIKLKQTSNQCIQNLLWNFLMVCGQKQKNFLSMKKEVRDLINESVIEEKFSRKLAHFESYFETCVCFLYCSFQPPLDH